MNVLESVGGLRCPRHRRGLKCLMTGWRACGGATEDEEVFPVIIAKRQIVVGISSSYFYRMTQANNEHRESIRWDTQAVNEPNYARKEGRPRTD